MTISDETGRLEILSSVLAKDLPPLPYRPVQMSVGDMDDAALIALSSNESLVITSDFVRGPHFYLAELGYLQYRDLGYYLIAANLSDLAAMGARPIGLTTVVRYEKTVSDDQFREVFEGIKLAADEYGVHVVGGDIGEYKSSVLSATAVGLVNPANVLKRSGAVAGDLLCVTGKVGLPITALLYFKDWKKKGLTLTLEEEEELLNSWRRPHARLAEGVYLAENQLAHACQDISDGLKATIEQMSKASKCFFTIDEAALPIAESTMKLAEFIGCDPVGIAVSASVDFELLFTADADQVTQFNTYFADKEVQAHIIGQVNSKERNLLRGADGNERELPGVTWKQQTTDYLLEIAKGGKRE